MHRLRCARYWLWALAGGLLTFTLIAAASIGLFVLPFAVAAVWIAAWRGRRWAEGLGVFAGAAAVCLAIAGLHAGSGGLDAAPWLAAGVVLAAVSLAGYALLSRRLPRRS